MKKLLSVGFGVVVIVGMQIALGRAQGNGRNPFFDRSDNGEIVKILPTPAAIHAFNDDQPRFATGRTQVNPASYGSGNLTNHGGPQIANAGFQAVYWNSSVATSTATGGHGTVQSRMRGFVNSFSDGSNWDNSATDDYTIIQQYGSTNTISAAFLNALNDLVDTKATTGSIKDSAIRSYIASLFSAHKLTPSSTVIYGVYFPPGMKVMLQGASCSAFCGYHGSFNYNGTQIKYAAFPYLNCSACSMPGLSVGDMLTIVTSHEIREAVTDPLLNAWYDAAGYEADDKCAWHNLYQTNGGFWVQPEFSNGGTVNRSGFTATYPGPGCIVPNK